MSTWAQRQVRCPCGHVFLMDLADGLHITRIPAARARILDGTFHNGTCPACGVTRVVQTKTLYTDFERYQWVAVAPPWLVGDWESWVEVVRGEFDHNMRVAAPPMIREVADAFTLRLVFGLDALAEKLRAWDAGLDDRLIEALKLRLIHERPERFAVAGFRLRLAEVDQDQWTLTFSLTRPGVPGQDLITVSLDAYVQQQADESSARASAPELFTPPFCAVDQFFATTLSAAAQRQPELLVLEPMRPQDAGAPFSTPLEATK